jgi:hypothetical protein
LENPAALLAQWRGFVAGGQQSLNQQKENEMKEELVVADELRAAKTELATAEAVVEQLRGELRPLVEERVEAEMAGKKVGAPKERRILNLRSKLDEAEEIAKAKAERVRQLHLLSVNKDVEIARVRQREFVDAVVSESQKIAPLLHEIDAIRRRISEVEQDEYLYIRSVNIQLGLQGRDVLTERLRFNCGGLCPVTVDAEVFEEFSQRTRKSLLGF